MTDLDPMMSAGSGRNDPRARAADLFGSYSTGQKVAAGAAVVAVVLGVFFMTRMAGAGKYAPLFTDLQTSDAAAITEQLDAEGIPYQLVGGGTSILVPSDQVYSARLKVAADGIPSDSQVGYGVLDQQGLTTSEFGQRVGYQRAMEGELSTTIESLDVVETATVHLALPDKDAFALSDQKASASVLVSTTPGSSMSDEQVQTVVNLVASSIENLSPEAVTVADSEGNVLAAPGRNPGGAGGAGGAGGGGQKQTAQFEQSVAESIEAMLTKVVGPGATIATVSADLNFDETNVSRETFEVYGSVVINASGVWGQRICDLAGIGLRMFPSKGSMVIIDYRINNVVINRCRVPSDSDIIRKELPGWLKAFSPVLRAGKRFLLRQGLLS